MVFGTALAAVAVVLVAIGLLARRIRGWKEQILHAVAVVESNNAIAHEATRARSAEQLAAIEKHHAIALEVARREFAEKLEYVGEEHAKALEASRAQFDQVKDLLYAEILATRREVGELVKQTNLGRVVRGYVLPGRLAESAPRSVRYDAAVAFLRSLDASEALRGYLETHLRRLARTLDIVPAPGATGRALELGAYMQITPALACLLGYEEVRGGYFGTPGETVQKSVSIAGKEVFRCEMELFDVDRDRFPYADGYFDVVLACEILEHLRLDPMHMMLEAARVLAPGGALILTTPNVASFTSVGRVLNGRVNPQIYSHYPVAETEVPHVREYTPAEVQELAEAAGLRVEWLFTEAGESTVPAEWITPLLEHFGFPTDLRGEQMYCVARKAAGSVVRRPAFLYQQP